MAHSTERVNMTFLYLNSDTMGKGNDELGKKLLVSFMQKLAMSDIKIDVVGCVNNGIFLTTKDSQVIDSLTALQDKGAHIVTCGTCLDFHQRRDGLLIGTVGSMDGTVQIMASADRVIRPC
ncbi:sulfurtransferase-like selenium metabolism protein YedF [candidate division KSB1 bacterium]|nr:MAG: sulfurtransferase-like selenium metabolism protein YedF [candidate division KSB1 bacterium]